MQREYKDSLVCFADILGTKERVLNLTVPEALAEIEKLDFIFKKIVEPTDFEKTGPFPPRANYFSDCFCISEDIDESNLEFYIKSIFYFFQQVQFIQGNLINQKMLLRGGVTINKHYSDDKIVFGEALIKAHELEKAAKYPRIVIDPGIYAKLADAADALISKGYDGGSRAIGYDMEFFETSLKTDQDGTAWLNYLEFHKECEDYEAGDFLRNHRDLIVEGLARFQNDPHKLEKYDWLRDYHNEYLSTHKPIAGFRSLLIP